MIKRATETVSSPEWSSDSSLSSAPETIEHPEQDPIPSSKVPKVAVEETTLKISNSRKRGRSEPSKEGNGPSKRTKRGQGTRPSYNEGTEEEGAEKQATGAAGRVVDKGQRRGTASVSETASITVKVEAEEEVEVEITSRGAAKSARKGNKTKVETVKEEDPRIGTPKKPKSRTKATAVIQEKTETEDLGTPKKGRKRTKAKVEVEEEKEGGEETPKKVRRKRKTKEEKEAEAMPLAARTAGLKMYVGAHVSSAKGLFSIRPAPCLGQI